MQRIEKMKLFVGKDRKRKEFLRVTVGLTGLIGGAVLSAVSAAFLERQNGYRVTAMQRSRKPAMCQNQRFMTILISKKGFEIWFDAF